MENLINSFFIIIPTIYIIFLISCILIIVKKIIRLFHDIDKILNKTRNLSEDIDKVSIKIESTYKTISEENYNFYKLIQKLSTEFTKNVDKNNKKKEG